jgi:hypothetical protein
VTAPAHPDWSACPDCEEAAAEIAASGGADFDYPSGPFCRPWHRCPLCRGPGWAG